MEFNRLLSSAISTYGESKFSGSEIKNTKSNEESTISKENYYLIRTEEEVKEWLDLAEELGEFAIDTETSSLDPHKAKLIGISISYKKYSMFLWS